MNNFLWDITDRQTYPKVSKDITTDILIIGAGMAGISTAFYLKDSGYKITVVDQNLVGHGVTRGTTGKITYLQDDIYQKIERTFNFDAAKKYYNSQKEAIELIKKNVTDYKIDCDFIRNSSYIFINDNKDSKKIYKEKELLEKFGVKQENIELHVKTPFPFESKMALEVNDTYIFHPLKYLYSLCNILSACKNIKIYEHSMVKSIDKVECGYNVAVNNKNILAKKVIVCCHYPYFISPCYIPFKTHLEKSNVIAASINNVTSNNAISIDKPINSVRYYTNGNENYLIYLNNTHYLGNQLDEKQNKKVSISLLKQHFNIDEKQIKYFWSNYDLMTADYLPYIGSVGGQNDSFYIATGFNTWGITNSTIAGKVIADLITSGESLYRELFCLKRAFNFNKCLNYFIDGMTNSKNYVLSKVKRRFYFYPSNVHVIVKNFKRYGVFIDKQRKKHIVTLLCPHMKCSLFFNPIEECWECPCHGSKFDVDGNVLKGPSNFDIKVKEEIDL